MADRRPGIARIGIFSVGLRLLGSPISFIFSVLVARYLSAISITTFGAWQFIFVLVTGYFTIPGDLFSNITSRYTAEGKPVGGILLFNLISASISSFTYLALVPYFVSISNYREPFFFYIGVLMIFMIYLYKASSSISTGRGPRVNAISALAFQLVRLSAGIYAMYLLRLSIEAVILAYSLGYLAQILINLLFVKANFSVDFKVATTAVKKSIVFIIPYIQYILEATLVWVAIFLVRDTVPASYFESAVIVSNLVVWSTASIGGLVNKLGESKDPSLLETSLKLFSLAGSLFLLVSLVDGLPLLSILRPEYVAAYLSVIILSVSNLMRGFFQVFYTGVFMSDESLGVTSRGELRGRVARLASTNSLFSLVGVTSSVLTMLFLNEISNRFPPLFLPNMEIALLSASMSLGVALNSVFILYTSMRSAKEVYSLKIPVREIIVPIVSALVIGIVLGFSNFVSINPRGFINDVEVLSYRVLAGVVPFIVLNLSLNPYARLLIKKAFQSLSL